MEERIVIPIEARYYTYGNPDAPAMILALHGYGQLGSFFIRKFEGLGPEEYFVVVPEGLHRFYLNGTSGRVGASWMTKEARETDIQNYITYLDHLLDRLTDQHHFTKKVLLGFSQGGATASRYAVLGKHTFEQVILWASVFAPDMELIGSERFHQSTNYLVIGNRDPYYKTDEINEQQIRLEKQGIKFGLCMFDGEHQLDLNTLKTILHEA